jgi:hypothetical protein
MGSLLILQMPRMIYPFTAHLKDPEVLEVIPKFNYGIKIVC